MWLFRWDLESSSFKPSYQWDVYQSNNFLPYLPPSSLVSRHAMRWMSCCEMNSLVMTSSTWLKSALCSSDRTGTDFRYLSRLGQKVLEDGGDNVAQCTLITQTPISWWRLYKGKACNTYVVAKSSSSKHSLHNWLVANWTDVISCNQLSILVSTVKGPKRKMYFEKKDEK